ncbi:PIN domain-containing protein [Methylobacterium currus]|uniref:PIN domain-containing protein n=1 Tax=Methylobacterium currus TaxID=2051553 RepID=UPI000F50A5A0
MRRTLSHRRVDAKARWYELPLAILPFDAADAHRAGEIRAALSLAGTPIGPSDVLIAGQASQRGTAPVTRNVREFRRVPGLTVEDWEAEDIVH